MFCLKEGRFGSQVQREALQAVEQDGIVFIDEIDKIVTAQDYRHGKNPSPSVSMSSIYCAHIKSIRLQSYSHLLCPFDQCSCRALILDHVSLRHVS